MSVTRYRTRAITGRATCCAAAALLVGIVAGCGSSSHARTSASASPSALGAPSPSTTPIPGSPEPVAVPVLHWSGCGGGFQCATMKVPLDYANPTGPTINIAVIRHHAKSSTGPLVINPGGPGASGVQTVRQGLPFVSALQQHKDIIGFDPRGTGGSTNVNCGTHLDAFVSTDSSPDNQQEIDQLKAVSKSLADECLRNAGRALLEHVTTQDAARDLDLLRAALGMPKLDYLGFSYGTLLGAIYLELFPTHAGRVVLDGVLDPKLTAKDIEVQQSIAFEKALDDLLSTCASDSSCPFKQGGSSSLGAEFDRISAAVDAQPLATGQQRRLTQALFALGVAAGLYDRTRGWPAIESGLAEAQKGNGSPLLELSDSYDARRSDGTYPTELSAMYAINCTDRPLDGGLNALTATANQIKKQAPRLGPTVVWLDMPCVVWDVAPIGKAHSLNLPASVGNHVVIVGTTRDPATPYVNAQSLHVQIKGSRLLTYDGDGHTAVGRNGCIDNLVSAWLNNGVLPPQGARC